MGSDLEISKKQLEPSNLSLLGFNSSGLLSGHVVNVLPKDLKRVDLIQQTNQQKLFAIAETIKTIMFIMLTLATGGVGLIVYFGAKKINQIIKDQKVSYVHAQQEVKKKNFEQMKALIDPDKDISKLKDFCPSTSDSGKEHLEFFKKNISPFLADQLAEQLPLKQETFDGIYQIESYSLSPETENVLGLPKTLDISLSGMMKDPSTDEATFEKDLNRQGFILFGQKIAPTTQSGRNLQEVKEEIKQQIFNKLPLKYQEKGVFEKIWSSIQCYAHQTTLANSTSWMTSTCGLGINLNKTIKDYLNQTQLEFSLNITEDPDVLEIKGLYVLKGELDVTSYLTSDYGATPLAYIKEEVKGDGHLIKGTYSNEVSLKLKLPSLEDGDEQNQDPQVTINYCNINWQLEDRV